MHPAFATVGGMPSGFYGLAKTALRWRGSKHVRHSRHGVRFMESAPMTAHAVVTCRCGATEVVSEVELRRVVYGIRPAPSTKGRP